MDDSDLGMFAGGLLAFLVFLFIWHTAESQCQQKYNVYDCVFAGFEPAEEQPNDTE